MTNMCKCSIDDIELHYNYAPPTDIGRTKLNLGKSEIVLASTNIYKSNQVPVGYSFTQIPASAFEALDVDISNDSALEDLIEHKIFDVSSKGNMSVQLIASNEEESLNCAVPRLGDSSIHISIFPVKCHFRTIHAVRYPVRSSIQFPYRQEEGALSGNKLHFPIPRTSFP